MTPERYRQVGELYHAVLKVDRGARAAFLAEASGGDEALRREVESLLEAHEKADRYFAEPALEVAAGMLAEQQGSSLVGSSLGHYRVLSLLGAGGMGEVYLADDTKLRRQVALKVLPVAWTSDPRRLARFRREAQVLAALNHRNIAAIYGLEESPAASFLVLELVQGETLAEGIARRGAIPAAEALPIVKQVVEALEYAHKKGITHRDIKPENIALTPEGEVKVLDFGLAKALQDDESASALAERPKETAAPTVDGQILGTPAYMSPERARGKAAGRQTDIWAFGCVLYELLTGRRAFDGETLSDTLAAVLEREPDWGALPSSTPPNIHTLLRRCLQKDPNRRLHDIADARIEIEDAAADHPMRQTSRDDDVEPGAGAPKSYARRAGLFGLAAAGLLAISIVAYHRWHGDPEETALKPLALAVLPFDDLSKEKDQEYLGDGLAEEILSLLAGTEGLRVIARTSSFSFKGRSADIATIAQRLNVSHVLEGSVRKSGDRLRITAQLIDASDSSHVWAQTYERDLDDLFAVQSEIAAAVASALEITLSGRHAAPAVEDLDAYERYLQGRFFYNRRALGDLERALRHFQQALDIAPEYARAWAGLAGVYGLQIHDGAQGAEAPARLAEAIQRALAADPRLAEVQARAAIYHWDWGDPVVALEHFRRAQALDPDDPLVLSLSAGQAAWDGRFEEAIELQRRANALDPLSTVAHANLGNFLLAAGHLDEAKAEYLAARKLDPSTEPWWSQPLALVLILKQQFGEALELALEWPQSPERDQILALAHHALGRQEEADAALERLIATAGSSHRILIAEVYAYRGDIDAAFRWLEPLRDPPADRLELLNLRLSRLLHPLQADPRWWPGEIP